MPFIRSCTALVLGTAYLLFALVMTMAAQFDELRSLIPPEHFVLVEISGAIWMQIVVSIVGILMMTALAYYRSWSKRADKAPTKIKPIAAAAG